jgi:multidrug efflux pump subunit AcrB
MMIKLIGESGNLVSLGELVKIEETIQERNIYHKNLKPVLYVTGDVAGAEESPVYAIAELGDKIAELEIPEG